MICKLWREFFQYTHYVVKHDRILLRTSDASFARYVADRLGAVVIER